MTDIKEQFANTVSRFLETYTGSEDDKDIHGFWKFLSALAGSLTFILFESEISKTVALLVYEHAMSSRNPKDQFLNQSSNPFSDFGVIEIVVAISIASSPVILSWVISMSFRRGRPLRFYLIGFFLLAALYSFATFSLT